MLNHEAVSSILALDTKLNVTDSPPSICPQIDPAPPAPAINSGCPAYQQVTQLVTRTLAALPVYPALSRFKCRAVIDWLDIKIATQTPTNFDTVQKRLMAILGKDLKNWVEAPDEGPGRAATIFVIRLHDPKHLFELRDICKQLEAWRPFALAPEVVALEIAVDFYSRSHDRSDLEAMSVRLKRGIVNTGANPRQYDPLLTNEKSKTRSLIAGYEEVSAIGTYYSGMRDTDPVTWRIYLKETDHNQKPITDVRLHRARMEVTLRDEELTPYVTTLDSFGTMSFQDLATKFRCRIFVPPAPIASSDMAKGVADVLKRRGLNLGARAGQHELEVGKRRKFSQHSCADIEINTLVRGSLRGLTERFGAEKRGRLMPKKGSSRVTDHAALITSISSISPSPGSSPRLPATP